MLHHILVKWKEAPADAEALRREIQALFEGTLTIPGIHQVDVLPNVVNRPNRYDLLIRLRMDMESLSVYDESEPHRLWKERYSARIAQKAIFDCEEA